MADINRDKSETLDEKELLNDAFEKAIDSKLYREMPKMIGICTSLIAVTAVLLKGMFYFFEWGYLISYNIDASYIEMNSGSLMYSIIGYFCLAIIFLLSNYYAYQMLIKKKYYKVFCFIVLEVISFYFLLFLFNNISPIDALFSIVNSHNILKFIIDVGEIIILIVLLNIFGISCVYVPLRALKYVNDQNTNSVSISKNIIISKLVFPILSVFLSVTAAFFLVGLQQANTKKNFKIITEKVGKDTATNTRIFRAEGSDEYLSFYAVLYENREVYIISPINNIENTFYIDKDVQKVIGKENIETKYIQDIANMKDIYKIDLEQGR